MAVRLGGESGGQSAFGADSMNSVWHATGGTEGYPHVPTDGKPHTLKFTYDPEATPGEWPDPRLKKYLTGKRQTTEQILEKVRKDEPDVTKEQLEKRLVDAHAAGLIQYLQRTGHESVIGRTSWSGFFWFLKEGKQGGKGAMTMQIDNGPALPFKDDCAAQTKDALRDNPVRGLVAHGYCCLSRTQCKTLSGYFGNMVSATHLRAILSPRKLRALRYI